MRDSIATALCVCVRPAGFRLTPPCTWRCRYFSCREASSALFTALTAEAATAQFFTLGCGMDWVVRRLLTHPNIIVRCDAPVVKLTDDLRVTYGRGDAVGVDKFQVRQQRAVAFLVCQGRG